MEIVGKRPEVYDALFGSELQYMNEPALEEVSLSGLWRLYTRKSGMTSNEFGEHLELVPELVDDILTTHNRNARCGSTGGTAAYSIPNPDILETVTEITTRTMSLWEKAIWRRQGDLLFAPPEGGRYQTREERFLRYTGMATQCTIETGAAALRSLAIYPQNPFRPAQGDKHKIAAVLANWGPEFLQRWMNGTVIEEWLACHGRHHEVETWREVRTPSLLKRLLRQDTTNPLHGFEKFWTRLEDLSDAAIAEQMGWSEAEVAVLVTPGVRRAFAIAHVDPSQAVKKLKANMRLMTDENLARELGWTEEEVRTEISPSRRRQVAVLNPQDPLTAIKAVKKNIMLLNDKGIARRVGWPEEKVAGIFTPKWRRHIAANYLSSPLETAERVAQNVDALTYEAIAECLGWPIGHARIISYSRVKEYAMSNIKDPFAPFKVIRDVAASLSDEVVAECLGILPDIARRHISITERRTVAAECKTVEGARQRLKQLYEPAFRLSDTKN